MLVFLVGLIYLPLIFIWIIRLPIFSDLMKEIRITIEMDDLIPSLLEIFSENIILSSLILPALIPVLLLILFINTMRLYKKITDIIIDYLEE